MRVIVGVKDGTLVRVGDGPSVGVPVIVGSGVWVPVIDAVIVGIIGVSVGDVKKGSKVDDSVIGEGEGENTFSGVNVGAISTPAAIGVP